MGARDLHPPAVWSSLMSVNSIDAEKHFPETVSVPYVGNLWHLLCMSSGQISSACPCNVMTGWMLSVCRLSGLGGVAVSGWTLGMTRFAAPGVSLHSWSEVVIQRSVETTNGSDLDGRSAFRRPRLGVKRETLCVECCRRTMDVHAPGRRILNCLDLQSQDSPQVAISCGLGPSRCWWGRGRGKGPSSPARSADRLENLDCGTGALDKTTSD